MDALIEVVTALLEKKVVVFNPQTHLCLDDDLNLCKRIPTENGIELIPFPICRDWSDFKLLMQYIRDNKYHYWIGVI